MSLPAAVRKKFNNDPSQLLDNLEDPATTKILGDAGLLNPEKEPPKDERLPADPDPLQAPATPPAAPPSAPLGQ